MVVEVYVLEYHNHLNMFCFFLERLRYVAEEGDWWLARLFSLGGVKGS